MKKNESWCILKGVLQSDNLRPPLNAYLAKIPEIAEAECQNFDPKKFILK